MRNLRQASLMILCGSLVSLLPYCTDGSDAQDKAPASKKPAAEKKAETEAPAKPKQKAEQQATGPIVAAPGATVVAPAADGASSGLIVAAPGSTVVVQQVPPAPPGKKSGGGSKPKTFSSSTDASIITTLVNYATKKSYKSLPRAGAIDALGNIGGADQSTTESIARGLVAVLDMEFQNGTFTNVSSEFLCFHAVQAIGKLGWGARAAIPHLQLLRGQNVILDSAIDNAISAMQNAPPPQTAAKDQGDDSATPADQ